ncbi:MAG: VCBS repeat-containing protein [Pirellulales bacterium]
MSVIKNGGPGGASSIADLNQDGFVDIAFPEGVICWGSEAGFSEERRQQIGVNGHGVSVTDLNRDGYLDLLYSYRNQSREDKSEGVIVWGAKGGFDVEKRTTLQLRASYCQSGNFADFNRDGWLDLIFGDVDSPAVDLFWGGVDGFSDERCSRLTLNNASTIEIADLNLDGWLDFTLGGGWDSTRFGRPTKQALIVWGSDVGFSEDHVTQLESFCSLEQSVADVNRDGYLDLIMTNYHAYVTRTLQVFIYWGNEEGSFSESRRTSLPAESSSALTVADLNQDSWPDLVAVNHILQGDHGVGTNIFWGSGEGYSDTNRHWFQTFGSHFSLRWDVGNIYNRSLEEQFISAPLECPKGKRPSRIAWNARTPHGTSIRVRIRTASSREGLAESTWHEPSGNGSSYEDSGSVLSTSGESRWLQYRVSFRTPDGRSTPSLEQVLIDVN